MSLWGVDAIENHFPEEFLMPDTFREFVEDVSRNENEANCAFTIGYESPEIFEIDMAACQRIVPFLLMPDGSLVAFWFRSPSSVPVAYMRTEGEFVIIADSFKHFLSRLSLRARL